MRPRQRRHIQEQILDDIKASHPGTTDAELGAAAGCCRSHISRLRNGERELDLSGLVGLIRAYGAVAALGPMAALDDCRVISCEPAPSRRDLRDLALELGACAGRAVGEVREALVDGHLDAAERAGLRATAATLRLLAVELEQAAGGGR